MSQTDNELKGVKRSGRSNVTSFNQVMSGDIGEVTSRDQFIDPYSLVNPNDYKKTRAGQAQYNADLQQAQLYLQQQQAAYQEWYESPEQQAIRDREAGLNPDLIGLSDGEAGEVATNPNSPIAGQETNLQAGLNTTNSIVGVIQTAASIAALPYQLQNLSKSSKLIGEQADAAELSNITAFEGLTHKAISDKFATAHSAALAAGESLDIASWFADDKNFEDILPSYAPSDHPRYASALARVRKATEPLIASAYDTTSQKLTSKENVARALGSPFYDEDTKIMIAQLSPVMEAVFELEKATVTFQKQVIDKKREYMNAVDATRAANLYNDVNEAKSAYIDAIDPSEAGEKFMESLRWDTLYKKHQQIISRAQASIYDNFRLLYEDNPTSMVGFRSAAMILGQLPRTWKEFLAFYAADGLGMHSRGYRADGSPESQAYVDKYIEEHSSAKGLGSSGRGGVDSFTEEAWRKGVMPVGFKFGD